MSERTSFNATRIGGHANSAFTPIKNVGKHPTNKKDAFAYIKTLFNTCRVLPEIKNK